MNQSDPIPSPPPPATVRSLLRSFRRSFSSTHLQCENARFVVAELPLAADRVRAFLPLGMWPSDPAIGTLFIVDYTRPDFTEPYREAALLLHVRTPLGRGVHCCWIVVDHDTPMIYGRETLAYPKKMADFTFEESGDAVRVSVTRRGIGLIELEAKLGQPLSDPGPIFGMKTFNVGGIGQLLGFNLVWLSRLTETAVESHALELDLTLRDSAVDPIASLVTGPPRNARMVIEDIAGARYLLPVGIAGPRWFARTFLMRYR